jgi:hypothetical protein
MTAAWSITPAALVVWALYSQCMDSMLPLHLPKEQQQ